MPLKKIVIKSRPKTATAKPGTTKVLVKPRPSPAVVSSPVKVKPVSSQVASRIDKGLSLMSLMKTTPPYVKMKAKPVVIKKYEPMLKTKGGFPYIAARCVSSDRSPMVHKQTIIGTSSKSLKVSKQKKVLVSCSCEWFLYNCEYALSTWGAAQIKFSNGEPAIVTNPGNYPMFCKHLVKVAKLVIEKGD